MEGPVEIEPGIIMRRARPDDAEALARFNGAVHAEGGWNPERPDRAIEAWTRDLLSGHHLACTPAHALIVENTRRPCIVASTVLIPQTWRYESIPFGVGRVELVGTHPAYRGRGLIRRQMEVLHHDSSRAGHLVQAITGIPTFYRQFGYEMALELAGSRTSYATSAPALPKGKSEPFRFRPARETDLQSLAKLYNRGMRRYCVACERKREVWRYELAGMHPDSVQAHACHMLETATGAMAGFVRFTPPGARARMQVDLFEVGPTISWYDAAHSLLRHLRDTEIIHAKAHHAMPAGEYVFALGSEHPAYTALEAELPKKTAPYAYWIRMPHMPVFLERIGPVLESRLAGSVFVNFTGRLAVRLDHGGCEFRFVRGKLTQVLDWAGQASSRADAGFPHMSFVQLIMGHRSYAELHHALPDCWASPKAKLLLEALFPKRPSLVAALG